MGVSNTTTFDGGNSGMTRNAPSGGSSGGASPSLDRLFDRLPPHSVESEMALLGSMIIDPTVIPDTMGIVRGADRFYHGHHGAIYEAIVQLYDTRRSLDLVQLVEVLRDADVLKDAGGEDYLVQLADQVPSAVAAPHYAKIVADKARLRDLIRVSGEVLYDAYHANPMGEEGVREIMDRAEMKVFEVAKEESTSDPQELRVLVMEEYDRIEAQDGTVTGLRTGFVDLDEKVHGLHPGEMLVLAARPSMGKTALALNLAEQLAMGGRTPWSPDRGEPSLPVAFFSLEMTKQAVTHRLISAYSGVSAQKFREGKRLHEKELEKVFDACNKLSQAPIFIDDTPALTVMQLRARARRLHAQHGVRAILIDYLQLLTAPGFGRENRQVEVSAISRQIKALAHELDVPIVCLSQLNRSSEDRRGNKPRMSDLRESGAIEQDADVVMLLHREEYYHIGDDAWFAANPDKEGEAELIIAKQRNGPTGVVYLQWDNDITRFLNRAHDSGYDHAHDARGYEPKASFQVGQATGPVGDFRDGGGPPF